jgi:hypothetical protein
MSWRESAIKVVLEYEFCDLWSSLEDNPGGTRASQRVRSAAINDRRVTLELLSDDVLFEQAREAASARGYDRGVYDESYSNSMAASY